MSLPEDAEPLPGNGPLQPVATGDAAPEGRHLDTSAIRRALLRALLSGVAGTLTCVAIGLSMSFSWRGVGNVALQGFFGGAILGAVALFESVAWPHGSPSRRRLVSASATVWPLAGLLCLGALLESVYARSFLDTFDSVYARSHLEGMLRQIRDEPKLYMGVFGVLGLPFALGALARGCALRVPEQVAVSSVGAVPPAAVLLLGTELVPPTDSKFCFGIAVAAAVFLPVAAWLGDWVERRWWQTEASPRARQRALAWAGAGVLLVIGTPLAFGFGSAVVTAREAREAAIEELRLEVEELITSDRDYTRALALCVEAEASGLLGGDNAYMINWLWAEAAWFTGDSPPPEWVVEATEASAVLDNDIYLRDERARFRLEHGDFKGAVGDFDFLEQQGAVYLEIYVLRAGALLELGKLKAAEADLANAASKALTVEDDAEIARVHERLQALKAGE